MSNSKSALFTGIAAELDDAGKILQAIESQRVRSERKIADAFVGPRNPVEETLAENWSEILGVQQVGVHDDFFQLGGHSLFATQLVSRIQSTFGVDLPLRAVFEHPTIASLAMEIDLLRQSNLGAQLPSVPATVDKRKLPVSFSQERMWFIHQLQPANAGYNIPVALRLKGPLNLEALEQSVQTIVERHESLRTTIRFVDDELVQVVSPRSDLSIHRVDLTNLPLTQRDEELDRQVQNIARQPFDLIQGPLLRVTLFGVSKNDHLLLVTMHHVVSDAWSFGVFIKELIAVYNANCHGEPNPLRSLPMQSSDFAAWQRNWFQGEVLENQMQYWRRRLHGLPVLALPTDHPRPALQTMNGAQISIALDNQQLDQLRTWSRTQDATLCMTTLAAFLTLLNRYTSQDDVAVGFPVANRRWLAVEGLIGTFVNTLVLRTQLSSDLSFRELVQRVRNVTLEAYAHQDLPFEKLVKELQPQRDLSHSPLVQAMFNYVNIPMPEMQAQDLELNRVDVDRSASQFDLTLTVIDIPQEQQLILEYNTDLFDARTIQRFAENFQQLLSSILADPDECLSRVAILAPQERRRLMSDWNDTKADYTRDKYLHQLVEQQARKTPEAVAVEFEDEQLTYRMLDDRANALAAYLHSQGVSRGTVVGVCLPRSAEVVVALLGILKAGGTFLPLDSMFPLERIAYMLADAAAPLWITHGDLASAVKEHLGAATPAAVCLDVDWQDITMRGSSNWNNGRAVQPVTSQELAYLIYTSGSTGRPKGVQIPHRAVVNFLHAMAQQPGLTAQDVLVSVTTISFDISVLEIFLPLITGARVIIASHETACDGHRLAKCLRDCQATVMQATPATWRLLLESGWKGASELTAFCGGDRLTKELAGELLPRVSKLWNMYGPTETTVWSTVSQINAADDHVTIGRPIGNTDVYILDNNLQPVPIGVAGELYVGGDGVACGYHGQPKLTAEKFVDHPFHDQPDARLYRTGDLARYLPSGLIDLLGRADYQVKIRGFRIEPGEIETVLRQHSRITDAVVVACEYPSDHSNTRLVAYVTHEARTRVNSSDLRHFLQQKLPDYMVPAHFVSVDTFPLTPNGKIDRRKLQATERRATQEDGCEFVPPRDSLEKRLVDLWQDVLELDRVGITNDFFDLGGHSLLAVRLLAQIECLTGQRLPMVTIFQSPTIEQLAGVLRNGGCSPTPSLLMPIQSKGKKTPVFFVHGHDGNILGYRELARRLGSDQPFYGLLTALSNNDAPSPLCVESLAARYISEIKTVAPEGPYVVGGYCLGGLIALEIAQQLRARGDEVAILVMIQTENPDNRPLPVKETMIGRLIPQLCYRLRMEADNFLESPKKWRQFRDRLTRLAVLLQLRTEQALALLFARFGMPFKHSRAYNVESLAKAYIQAGHEYQPRPYKGRTIMIRAAKQPAGAAADVTLGWKELLVDQLDLFEIPGHRIGMLSIPRVAHVAGILTRSLEQIMDESNRAQRAQLLPTENTAVVYEQGSADVGAFSDG